MKDSGHPCPGTDATPPAMSQFKQLDDQHLVYTAEDEDTGAWEYNIHKGFTKLFDFSEAHGGAGIVVANRGYAECAAPQGP